jgi:hypothetical protein
MPDVFSVKNIGWNDDESRWDVHEQVVDLDVNSPEGFLGGWLAALAALESEHLSILRTDGDDDTVAYTAEAVDPEGRNRFVGTLILSDLPTLACV